jgi:solute carrier family 35 (UDP-sugar transporter), member A1/2/3
MAVAPSDSSQALLYCILLAFQFGLQPMIANRFTSADISKTSVVIGTEFGKIIIAFMSIMSEPSNAREKIFGDWTLFDSIKIAALPATLYAIQNLFVQHGYVLLDSMTFNLLNQTKVSYSNHNISALISLFF